MIRHIFVQRLGCQVTPSSQFVYEADGSSPLHVVGETRFPFTCKGHTFAFEGLVIENLDVDILAVTPFMESNDNTVRPAKRQVILGDGTIHNWIPATSNNQLHRMLCNCAALPTNIYDHLAWRVSRTRITKQRTP